MRDNLVAVVASDLRIFDKIMNLDPWLVMGYPVALQIWDAHKTIDDMDFSFIKIWVQTYELSLNMMSKNNAIRLVEMIGFIVEVECCSKIIWEFLRV